MPATIQSVFVFYINPKTPPKAPDYLERHLGLSSSGGVGGGEGGGSGALQDRLHLEGRLDHNCLTKFQTLNPKPKFVIEFGFTNEHVYFLFKIPVLMLASKAQKQRRASLQVRMLGLPESSTCTCLDPRGERAPERGPPHCHAPVQIAAKPHTRPPVLQGKHFR